MKAIKALIADLFSVEMLMYILFGVGTAAIDYFTETFLYKTLTIPSHSEVVIVANTVSFILSVTFAFFTNKYFVFKSKSTNRRHMRNEALKFFFARLLTFSISIVGMVILVDSLSFNNDISKIIVSVVVIVLNYILSKLLIFKKQPDESKQL